jgi:glucose 1-dehydrogenase
MKDYFAEQGPLQTGAPACPIVKSLKGQTALVTGANSGIGRAIATALGSAGANVVINYVHREDAARETLEEVQLCGGRAIAIAADVGNEQQVRDMFERTLGEFGSLDILVNNAGLQKDAPFHEMTTAQWDTVMNVNLRGQFLCTREAVRIFIKQGIRKAVSCSAGKIICISSVHDVIPWAGHVNYAASKGGVMLMMKSVAQEVAPLGIRVNSICPGAVRTPINTEAWSTPQAYNSLMKLIPYKRIGEPVELGRASVWLASDDSDYITGASLYVDGGMTLYPGFETGG